MRRVMLIRFQHPDLEFLTSVGLEQEKYAQFEGELISYFARNGPYVRDRGLMFSHVLDTYFYVQTPPHQPDLYIMTSHEISSCMSFYYNILEVQEAFQQYFGSNPDSWLDDPEQSLSAWAHEFEQLTPEKESTPYSYDFKNDLHDWITSRFRDHLGEFLYSLLMQIPIVIATDDDPEMVASFFSQLVTHLRIHIGDQPSDFHHVHIVKEVDLSLFNEVMYLDDSGNVTTTFVEPHLVGMSELVRESMEYHELMVMSFDVGMYNHLFWALQKVYGVLIMHVGPVDFSVYLHQEKIQFLNILTYLFNEMTFLDNLYV